MNKYFTYDPENNVFETYATAAEQSKAAKEIIDSCLDNDGWSESVEDIIGGIITEKATKYGVIVCPETLDDDGYDEEGRYWPEGVDYICNYEMKKID